jgi:hypothetical protein
VRRTPISQNPPSEPPSSCARRQGEELLGPRRGC